MNKAYIKFVVFIIGVSLAFVMTLIGLRLLTAFIASFQQGANAASIFKGHVLIIPEPSQVIWVTTSPKEGTLPSQSQLDEIIAAYWLAWDSVGQAHLTDDRSDLKTYWAGFAYQHLISGIIADTRTSIVTHNHALFLDYFSNDGSVVAFRDEGFFLRRTIDDQDISVQTSAQIVMTLDQGFWRIRQIELHYD